MLKTKKRLDTGQARYKTNYDVFLYVERKNNKNHPYKLAHAVEWPFKVKKTAENKKVPTKFSSSG